MELKQISTRSYPYRITLLFYSGRRETHHIMAQNQQDAFNKGHRFSDRYAYFLRNDGVQFLNVTRLTKAYVAEHGIRME